MDFPTIVTTRRIVKNIQPISEPHPYKIAIIGEAPGEVEENYCTPFVGPSGNLLNSLLRDSGIDRNKCFIGNVCQVRPPANEISRFEWSGAEIQDGLKTLKHDLDIFKPNICLLLGNTPLRAARADLKASISSWSGSLFLGSQGTPMERYKSIAGFHPAGILRFWGMEGNFPRLKHVIDRTRDEASSPDLILPQRELITHWDAVTLCRVMDEWPSGTACSLDIEGGLPNDCVNDGVRSDSKKRRHIGWRCVALSSRPSKAFAIAWWKFSPEEHGFILRSFARLMARVDVPKVLQNSLYDNFVMSYGYGILIRNVRDDTMLKSWELYCELPKSLSVQASIHTREPHWKDEEMYESTGEALAIGCCKDVAVTYEISEVQDQHLSVAGQQHYRTNVTMLNPALYMELRGIKYDQDSVNSRRKETSNQLATLGESLSVEAGTELRGKLGSLSSQRLAKILYESKGYEPQYKKENGRKTDRYTTDVEAILNLKKKNPDDQFLAGILRHRHLEGLLETLSIVPDNDGRVRCAYNVVGTETGRFSCKTSPTGSGANLTTITKSLRSNYIADDSYDFFQCDLAGADGWTVAAHCNRLGDPTMLQDYIAGLKPAKIVSGLHAFGGEFNQLDRDDLRFWGGKATFNAISMAVGNGIYDCAKRVQHGSNYLMGIPTMQKTVMIASFKETGVPIYMDHVTASQLQSYYFSRYPGIRLWHNWAEATLVSQGKLTSATGHTRVFFGRRFGKDIHDTVKEFLADEPQQNTTWATNLAMLKLWKDPANRVHHFDMKTFTVHMCDGSSHYWAGPIKQVWRIVPGSLLIEPLHQVHDALCGQWPSFLRDWARAKVKTYFDNELTIAGIPITIPFEGAFGPSWGECKNPL